MRRRIGALLLAACCLIGGIWISAGAEMQKRTMYFFDTFDTMITIIGYTESQATFDRITGQAREEFVRLHKLFDAYHEYEGIQNVFTLNRDATAAPVEVSPELMGLLTFAKEWQPKLQGSVNIALGAALRLWHEYRTEGTQNPNSAKLPPMAQLQDLAGHGDFVSIVLDREKSTVYFSDPKVKLDVGAVAKGYATEWVAQMLLASDMPNFILNAGGNVRTGNPPLDGRKHWGVSIQDPDSALGTGVGEEVAEVFYLSNLSVVTSGDYERFYVVDGVRYHHIISPETLMPATENRAITVVCEDSGLADILSTAVFVLPYDRARALIESIEGAEALWIRPDGEILLTDGLKAMSKSGGATN